METQSEMTDRPRGRRLRAAWALAVAALAVLIAAGVLKYWLGPRAVASRVRRELARVWDGPVSVGRVDFAFTAPSKVHGVELADRAGRRWLRIDKAVLTLKDVAGGDPELTRLEVDGVDCEAHLTDGRFEPPWRRPGKASGLRRPPKRITVRRIRLRGPGGTVVDDAGMTLTLADGKGTLTAEASAPIGTFTLGPVPIDYDIAGRKVSLERIEGAVVLTPPGEGDGFWRRRLAGMSGRGTIRLRGSGGYDPVGATPWRGALHLEPENLAVVGPDGRAEVVSNVRWDDWEITPSRLEVVQLTGTAGGGTVMVQAIMDDWADGSKRLFDAAVVASGVDLAAVATAASPGRGRKVTGKADLTLLLHGRSLGWDGLEGRGKGRVTGADLWPIPVISVLFERLQLARAGSLTSEGRAVFDLKGSVVHIKRAVVTNQLAGLECTEGTVDLRSCQVDLVVVGGTFLTLNRLTGVLGADARGKLLGHRIRGPCDRIGPKDLVPVAATTIAESSIELLRRLSKDKGKIGQGLGEMLEGLFKGTGSGTPTQPTTAP